MSGEDLPGRAPADSPEDLVGSFPRRYARTRRFSLGVPRAIAVSPDGARVAFLRSGSGEDPVTRLHVLDVASGRTRCALDPTALGIDESDLPPEERARRERVREGAGGVVTYATDQALALAVAPLGGRVVLADLAGEAPPRDLGIDGPAVDPRPDPTGRRLAWVARGAVLVASLDDVAAAVAVARADGPDETVGLAEFVAAEEMGRGRGYWWSPDGERLAVARVDTAGVARWHLADPANPEQAPSVLRYPAAGTANARVTLEVVAADGSGRVPVRWDQEALPYLADVRWDADGPLTLVLQTRDQRCLQVRTVDPATGETAVRHEDVDADWVELVAGCWRWLPGRRLVHTIDDADTRRLAVDGRPWSPPGLQIRRILHAGGDGVVVTASAGDPTAVGVWRVTEAGAEPLCPATGVHDAAVGGGTVVLQVRGLDEEGVRTVVAGPSGTAEIPSMALPQDLPLRARALELGQRRLRGMLLLPSWWAPDHGALPVLVDPYGGPHAQRVAQRRDLFGVPQWFAEQGLAVLVVDGRGTPGRGPGWERAIAGDLATAPLEDQVDGLLAADRAVAGALDLDRVAIRGWSFGGYLAALAVLRRPDVFAAAIAGAPVADWRLYDTHYTERYLGDPAAAGAAYDGSSLLADAPNLARPLLLIHGLADDNVVAAHTLRLSAALLAAGRPHEVLPLSGVTHMTPQEVVAENLLRLQVDFLRRTIGLAARPVPTQP